MRISDWSSDVCSSDLYQNIAFTLERNRLPINEVADLAYYGVMAFQNARRLLGPALLQTQRINTRYHEVANQIGRASCRERVCQYCWMSMDAESLKKKNKQKSHQQSIK